MFIINSSRPKTLIISFQTFGFTQTLKGCVLNICDKFKNFKRKVLIATLKFPELLNSNWRKLNIPHGRNYFVIKSFSSSIVNVTPFPNSISSIDLFNFSKNCSLVSGAITELSFSFTAMVMSEFVPLTNAIIFLKSYSLNSEEGTLNTASIKNHFIKFKLKL